MNSKTISRERINLPLVIGVTGHRDLRESDREPLEERVRFIFTELQLRYPHTPLILLSPLAEGTDRLVTKVALEEGVRLIVPLPMQRVLYEEDFQTEISRDEFGKLLQQADRWFELPLLEGKQEEEVRQPGPARDRQYAQAGAYIVLHSQILIALWDGRYSNQVGGTSEVVKFQLQGVPEPYAPPKAFLDEPESGPVYHIVTPRLKNPNPIGRPFELHRLLPDGNSVFAGQLPDQVYSGKEYKNKDDFHRQDEFYSILSHLDSFNQDARNLTPRLSTTQQQSKVALLDGMDLTTLPFTLKNSLSRYVELYAIADSLALFFRNQSRATLRFLFGLVFLAVLCFDVYAHLVPSENGALRAFFLFLYLTFLIIAYITWYYRATRRHYKNKYLDYRAIAEGLRVQFFWRLAGLSDSVANHYLRKQKSELDWIRNSMRTANLLCEVNNSANDKEQSPHSFGDIRDDCYRLLLKHWVDPQRKYFTTATRRDHDKRETNERWVHVCLLLGIGVATLLLIMQLASWFLHSPHLEPELLQSSFIVIMSLLLVLAALRESYADKMAFAEQVKQYQRMSRLYEIAFQRLQAFLEQGKPQDAERVIRELGEEALAENGDWVLLHRTRPITVPMGG